MKTEFIPFPKLEAFKNKEIFTRYIQAENISIYFRGYTLDKIVDYNPENTISQSLADELKNYNNAFTNDKSVNANIEKLTKKNAYAVITGQQPHIYAGPLYTIYKIITTIKLCKSLTSKTGHDYVPVFWNGSDDHDIDEINKAEFPNVKYGLDSFSFNISHTGEPIYSFNTKDEYEKTTKELISKLRETEFTGLIKDLLGGNTRTIGECVTSIYKNLFYAYGLVVLEPRILRKHSAEIYKNIILNDEKINEIVNETGKGKGHLIHKDNSSNLFSHITGKREKIKIENGKYIYNNKEYSSANFAELVYENAENFSPGVSARPGVQDYLFPTCAYVAGPGEISYFSQLKHVYKCLGVNMPAIFPRISATLITGREKRLLDKYGFSAENALNGSISIPDDKQTEKEKKTIQGYTSEVWKEMDSLTEYVKEKGNEPLQSISSALRKIEFELKKIEEKYIKAYEKMQGIERGHVEKINNALIPNKNLQERVFTPLYYINFFGKEFINYLVENTDEQKFMHHVIYLD